MSDIRRKMTTGRYGLVVAALAAVVVAATAVCVEAQAAEAPIKRQAWSFSGITGGYDQAQLQRGFKVFEEVCSKCHSATLLKYRNLGEPGGPGFSEGQVKTLAALAEIEDGPNDEGEMFKRPGRPSDNYPSPFANDNAARAANGGALPPDMSVLAKARGVHIEHAWYVAPFHWAKDIASGYQEGGPDYIQALLTGYEEGVPAGFTVEDGDKQVPLVLADGMNFNHVFPGNQIAMPPPLSDKLVEYTDGTPMTTDQYASDVSAFMMWMSEPKLNERKSLGLRVLIYLSILTFLLYLAKRAVWARVKH